MKQRRASSPSSSAFQGSGKPPPYRCSSRCRSWGGLRESRPPASQAWLPSLDKPGPGKAESAVQGGRPLLRRSIYMPALVATRFNADLKAKYEQLVRAGKSAKVAITAVMRKLVVMANALLRDGREWSETRP